MAIKTVALLGLGTMGEGMAANLLKAGFRLRVYNRTRSKTASMEAAGAYIADTPAEAALSAEAVIAMLSDDEASRDAWLGSKGALGHADKGSVLIEASTLSPSWVAELSSKAAEKNLEFIDAPVTGSRVQAANGELTFLVGGSKEALEHGRPVLEAMSKEIIHLGPVASGAKMKLVNNFLCGVQVASLSEAIAWLERSGLDRDKALAILRSGAPGSPLLGNVSARMTNSDYTVNFLLKLMSKDLQYAFDAAAENGVELSTAANARRLFEHAAALGYGDQDMSSVIEPLRKQTRG